MSTKTKAKFGGAAMFESIKAALNKSKDGASAQFGNILKCPDGHTYTLRLVPNVENPEKTFFHHWVHGWNSKSSGSYMSHIGLQTFDERDPISELRWKLWKSWRDANPKADSKDYVADITQKENWFVNVYVIDDPSNPNNNGTVKILRMGPQLKKIVDEATEGDRSDELGWDIFDLSKGHDLKIKAEKKGVYTTFESSFFTTKSKTVLDDEEIDKIHSNIHDLESVYPVKTYDELQEILNEHFFIGAEKETPKPLSKITSKAPVASDDEDEDDDIPMFHETKKTKTQPVTKVQKVQEDDDDVNIDDLLDELDN
jgi:hypothetical protein